jgi:hypothetical protein
MCKCVEKENITEMPVIKAVDLIVDAIVSGIGGAEEQKSNSVNLEKEIDKVVFNNPATIVFWKDGTKTVAKAHNGDTFNKETGLAMCIVRKLTNNRNYNKVFEKYCS